MYQLKLLPDTIKILGITPPLLLFLRFEYNKCLRFDVFLARRKIMQEISNHNKTNTIAQNVSYYDRIAEYYDQLMEQNNSNEIVRKNVSEKFLETTQPGFVLDFGGGTGKDISWLTEKGYKIIFCEPSVRMREKAIELIERNFLEKNIRILSSDNTDFAQWTNHLPFPEKTDAVLCNFAVINCIPDIKSLFFNLAAIMKPRASLIALILDSNLKKMMKQSRRKALAAAVLGLPFKFIVHSGHHSQVVYIHTDSAIKKASKKYFEFKSKESLSNYGFCLIHLVRK